MRRQRTSHEPNTHAYRLLIFKERCRLVVSTEMRLSLIFCCVVKHLRDFSHPKKPHNTAPSRWAATNWPQASLPRETKAPAQQGLLGGISSLTMSYFHTGIRTIIGAESFHCPVRDGKEWCQLAMVIRLKPFTARGWAWCSSFAESNHVS